MHVLLTGHTGFKGAWLTLLLRHRGHEVTGLALPAAPGSLHERARLGEVLRSDLRVDVRDRDGVVRAVRDAAPDVVVHLAAQALVRESYRDPRTTIETNVMGTQNVLEAVEATPSVRAHVVVTTDKVYRDTGTRAGYTEADPLGGRDPYAASKAAADVLALSWAASRPGVCPTAVARAGNVIGGGDVSPERLVVDLVAAFGAGRPAVLRQPAAIRPWQHVLDCLQGYTSLVDALLAGRLHGEAVNIGPPAANCVEVGQLADLVADSWGAPARWERDPAAGHPHESAVLVLDAGKAERELGWRNAWGLEETVRATVDWARRTGAGEDPRTVTADQVAAFESGSGAVRS